MAEEEEDEVDILHPLSTLHWEQGPSLSMDIVEARYVFVNNRLYVGSGMISHGTGLHDNEQLFIFSTNFDLLSKLTTPTTQFALTTYNSQPVLVGGVLSSTNKLSNQLWIRDEIKGIWDPSLLPPMPIARRDSSAINTGSTECIVVAGGCGETGLIDVVEILKQGQWLKLQHLPEPCWNMTSTLHNGKWYLNTMEGYMFCCKLESLLTDYEHSSDIWSKIDSNVNGYSIASFGQQLIIVGGSQLLLTRGIHALSPLTQSWVHIGDMHEELFYFTTIVLVLPTRELVVIGERVEGGGCSVLKASLTMSPYNSDNQFSMSALYRLEATGIYIVTSLYEVRTELEGILGVDKLWSVRKVISKWVSGRSRHPPTWRTILDILRKLDLVELSQQIEDYLSDNLSYIDAYRRILATQDSLEMLFVKIIFLGPPRLGKTTARRRLMGEIADISSAAEQEQPSTGAVESGGNVVMWTTSSTTALMTPSEWSVVKDLEEEACMLFQFFNMEQNHPSNKGSSEEKHTEVSSDKDKKFSSSVEEKKVHSDKVVEEKVHSDKIVEKVLAARIVSGEDSTSSFLKEQGSSNKPHGLTQIPKLFRKAVNRKYWKDIKRFFKDSALLKMEDTGGQPEFMDMLPALTIGPALYLLFCRLIDDLFSRYPVSYVSPLSGASTTPVESSYTVEEVLLTALASVSCFSSYSAISKSSVEEGQSSEVKEILESSFKSVAYIVGTHKDKVSEERIEEFDRQLQCSIRSTDFFRDLVKFYSEKRMILAIDNTNGGTKEIEEVRKFLEIGIRKHFKKLRIPASWLVFSLFLRGRPEKIASLNDCHQLAWQLNMPSKETKIALWFLHHYAGVLMYFPDLPELEDTVICDTKIIYDSVTNLIINTFKFGSVSKWASETFRETGQFSMEDIKGATSEVSGDFIPPYKLVKLLEHLNIITPIVQDDSHSFQARPIQSSNVTYFMPCVLQNASCEALDIYSSRNPASLMIRYKCGFVPLGIFPAVIAHLVGHSPLKLIVEGIKKNCVQFQYGEDRDTVTLIYRTKYFEIHIKREHTTVTQIHDVCLGVRNIIESTLKTVSIPLHYVSLHYQLSFECPSHPGEDHLCVVDSKDSNPHKMDCLKNAKKPQPVDMQDQHLFWFGKAPANNGGCTSGSNLQPEGDVREFNEELSCGDLYRYLLFEKVPKRDCDIIKEREISGVCFLDLSIQYLSCELSEPGVIVITKLQNKIKATQTTITPNLSSPAPDYQAYMSSLSPHVHPLLEQQLDWDHGGVDIDLNEIANHMLDWEDRLSAYLGLTRVDISDIKKIHLHQPPLQRREALKRWRIRCGLHATYGNLLKLCMEAGHTECAQVICDILKRKVEPHTSVSRVTVSSNVSTVSDSTDVREFSEELSCGDLYRYLLFKNVPKKDSGIIKEKEISGACFLDLSIQYLKSCEISEPGVIVITKLQNKIKATQTTITPNPSPHVSDVKEFSEELSSGDLYRYLLFEKVPKRDCDIIKEREISGVCFLDLSIQYWKSCELSEPGVIVITKLQNKIKAT